MRLPAREYVTTDSEIFDDYATSGDAGMERSTPQEQSCWTGKDSGDTSILSVRTRMVTSMSGRWESTGPTEVSSQWLGFGKISSTTPRGWLWRSPLDFLRTAIPSRSPTGPSSQIWKGSNRRNSLPRWNRRQQRRTSRHRCRRTTSSTWITTPTTSCWGRSRVPRMFLTTRTQHASISGVSSNLRTVSVLRRFAVSAISTKSVKGARALERTLKVSIVQDAISVPTLRRTMMTWSRRSTMSMIFTGL